MQPEIWKHVGVEIRTRDAGVEFLGAEDSGQSPTATDFQNPCPGLQRMLLQILHHQKTRIPELVPVNLGGMALELEMPNLDVIRVEYLMPQNVREFLGFFIRRDFHDSTRTAPPCGPIVGHMPAIRRAAELPHVRD